MRVVGVVLLVVAMLTFAVGGLAVMGDPFPISRAGITRSPDGLVIVNAVCPGERLVDLRLSERGEDGRYQDLWHITGDAPLPSRLQVGVAPAGFETVAAFDALPDGSVPLSLSVVTSELTSPYSMDFELSDVPAAGVLSFGEVFTGIDEFERASADNTPCGDPYSQDVGRRLLLVASIIAAVTGITGVALLVAARQRPVPP